MPKIRPSDLVQICSVKWDSPGPGVLLFTYFLLFSYLKKKFACGGGVGTSHSYC